MPYFFIAFALALYLVAGAFLLLAARFTEFGKPLFPYLWRAFACSLIGVVIANVVFMAVVMLFVNHADLSSFGATTRQAVGITTGLGILFGPVVVSGLGLVAGAVVGLLFGVRARRPSLSAPA